jgi:hypothetical protein
VQDPGLGRALLVLEHRIPANAHAHLMDLICTSGRPAWSECPNAGPAQPSPVHASQAGRPAWSECPDAGPAQCMPGQGGSPGLSRRCWPSRRRCRSPPPPGSPGASRHPHWRWECPSPGVGGWGW